MLTINEIIRSEVRKVVANAYWNQAPTDAPPVYAVLRIIATTSIHDKDAKETSALSSIRLQVAIFGLDPLIIKQYMRLLRQHMRKIKDKYDADEDNILRDAVYIVGQEGYVAQSKRFYNSADWQMFYMAVENDLTVEDLDEMAGIGTLPDPDDVNYVRRVNLHTHIEHAGPYGDAEVAFPANPIEKDTAIVRFTTGTGFYTYDGTDWVLNWVNESGIGDCECPERKIFSAIIETENDGYFAANIVSLIKNTTGTNWVAEAETANNIYITPIDTSIFDNKTVIVTLLRILDVEGDYAIPVNAGIYQHHIVIPNLWTYRSYRLTIEIID
jgi:hypothetical protein